MESQINTVWRILWDPKKEALVLFALISTEEALGSLAITQIEAREHALVDEAGWRYVLQCGPDDDTDRERVMRMKMGMYAVKDDVEDMSDAVWSLMK